MAHVLASFWAYLASLAGVVALYMAADAGDILWAFWLVVAGAVVMTATTVLAPRSVDWSRKVRDYDRLLEAAGRLQDENERLSEMTDRLTISARDNWAAGVQEGYAQFRGALLAQSLGEAPELVGVQVIDDKPALVARWSRMVQAPIGARFDLEVRNTGALRGVVEAYAYDEPRELLTLLCVRPEVPAFWQHLADRAEVETEPPKGLVLRPSSMGDRDEVGVYTGDAEAIEGTTE